MKASLKILPILFVLVFLGCSDDKANDNGCDDDIITATILDNSNILVTYNDEFDRNDFSIVAGNKLVFTYDFTAAQCDDISDDEFGQVLNFELPLNSSSFVASDADILGLDAYSYRYGAWVSSNRFQIQQGTIAGEKLDDNRWEITVNVTATSTTTPTEEYTIAFTETFEVED